MKVTVIAASLLVAATLQAQEPHAPSAHSNESMTAMESTGETGARPGNSPGEASPAAPELLAGILQRPRLGLSDFLDFAERDSPTLAQAKAVARRSAAQAHQAGLYPNPSVGYQGDQIRGGSYGGGEQGGFLRQTIVLGGKLGLRRDIYKQQSVADTLGVDEQTYRLRNDVTQDFYSALASQETVVTRRKLLGVALDAVETVHQLANVGQADVPDVLQTEVEAERAKVDYVEAQRQFLSDFHLLAVVAGKPDQLPCLLDGDLEATPDLDPDQSAANAVAMSPTLKRAQQEVAVATARLRDARRESVPDIDLRVGEQYSGEQVTEGPAPKAAGLQSFASAGVNLPLWNRNQGNVAAAEADLDRARQRVASTLLAIRETTEPFAQSYLSARFAADRYKTELIPRAQTAYRLSLAKYQGMAQAYPQVLVSQRTLFELKVDYLRALRETWRNAIALENYGLSGALSNSMAGEANTGIHDPKDGGEE